MTEELLALLRCPVTKTLLRAEVLQTSQKELDHTQVTVIQEGILFSETSWFFPVINGIPVLTVEAVIDHEDFFKKNMPDFEERRQNLFSANAGFIAAAYKKNKRTKESFTQEWMLHDPEKDKTWNADAGEMLKRFLRETDETIVSCREKIIFDAGCGNGHLNMLLAEKGILNIAMDFSSSVENAYNKNKSSKVHFIRGDVQFPPVAQKSFDIVHCSGVLIHTNNTEHSFSCIDPLVKGGGKLSVWLYHPRKNFMHNVFNSIRKRTSGLPLKFQYRLYAFTIFPVSWLIKKIKGSKQNPREMMIDILDWFTPEFRWEHSHEEVLGWFNAKGYKKVKITTNEVFGFNTTGIKSE